MKRTSKKHKRTVLIVLGSIVIFALVIILFISPIAKFLIEKYDKKYTGRQITLSWVYLNPFNGYAHLHNLKVFEAEDSSSLTHPDSVFFSSKGVTANFALFKLFSKTFEITKLTLNQPKGIVIQNKTDFNFNDLITKFTPKETDTIPSGFHFNILDIKIKNGEFHYFEELIPINYFIKNVNIETPGIRWNVDTLAVKFSFIPGIGTGNVAGDISVNVKNLDYNLIIAVQKFDLNIIQQYLNELANYGTFRAYLDADIHSKGNFKVVEKVTNKGILVISDFHFGKNPEVDYVSFDKFIMAIHEVSPGRHVYQYDSIMLIHPYFNYERYDELDNLQTMFGKDGSNIAAVKADSSKFNLILKIADYVKELAKNFYKSNYKVDKLMVEKGYFSFNDYSLTEKFSIQANPFTIYADSINKLNRRVAISFKSDIQPYGNMWANLSINPQDSSDFNMQYQLQGLPLALFNPYLINYTSFPFDKGTLEMNGKWDVQNGEIKSNNHLLVIDPRLTSKIVKNDKKHIPLRLIMYLIRDRGNVIDYSIPITGNLNQPDFHIRDVVFDILGNIFMKPPSTNYRMEIKAIENEIEKSLSLKWKPRQQVLYSNQLEYIDQTIDFLQKNTDERIDVYPNPYTSKEMEYILFFEAKKKYYLFINSDKKALSEKDSTEVTKMSVKDDDFINYLKKHTNDSLVFTVKALCTKLIGAHVVDEKFRQLTANREAVCMEQFIKRGVGNRVIIHESNSEIPYNGFSFYKIEYKGDFPDELIKASKLLDKYDDKAPRKRFEKKRKKNNQLDSTGN